MSLLPSRQKRSCTSSVLVDMASHGATGELEGFEIFIKYLPAITTEDGLSELFAEAGEIVGASLTHLDP